jgi:hypothetical protein
MRDTWDEIDRNLATQQGGEGAEKAADTPGEDAPPLPPEGMTLSA